MGLVMLLFFHDFGLVKKYPVFQGLPAAPKVNMFDAC